MITLHALLVGINAYPIQNHVLKGCLNDLQLLHDYLEYYCRSLGIRFRPLVLADDKARREDIIEGFKHFEAARAEECCLFQFSGHGARVRAPAEFQEPDHHIESLVCWDSRLPDGRDLLDKELSYLIWEASQRTTLPFVSIMDCCHSGDMRTAEQVKKDTQLEIVGVRSVREVGGYSTAPEVPDYLGMEHYYRTEKGYLKPPIGRRVHLGACRNIELAKEVEVPLAEGRQARGIFTHCLVEVLQNTGPLISYTDLQQRVNARIRQNVKDQSAQLTPTHTEDRALGFLMVNLSKSRPSLLVSWDKGAQDWFVNAGGLHGLAATAAGNAPALLELAADKRQLTVKSVQPNRAAVSGMDGLDTRQSYVATITQQAIPKLTLCFGRDNDPAAEAAIREMMERQASDMYGLEDKPVNANYLLLAKDGRYFLTGLHDDRMLFQSTPQTDPGEFLNRLGKVAFWNQVQQLQNPITRILESEIDMQLYRLSEKRQMKDMHDDAPMEAIDWQGAPCAFRYFADGEKPFLPAFQLKVKNNSHRSFWVGLLYLDAQFGISDFLLPPQMLGPGEEIWAVQKSGNHLFRTIPLQIDDPQFDQVDEFLKLLISTDELKTDVFNQSPLEVERENTRGKRTLFFPKVGQKTTEADWAAKMVWVRLMRKAE
ncbi:MAG: caspase family protein [Saprospiraceae bacterium]|nr:caspase family protein [Saprospiraceae bacterium]